MMQSIDMPRRGRSMGYFAVMVARASLRRLEQEKGEGGKGREIEMKIRLGRKRESDWNGFKVVKIIHFPRTVGPCRVIPAPNVTYFVGACVQAHLAPGTRCFNSEIR